MSDSPRIRVDFGNLMAARVEGGLEADRLDGDLQARFQSAYAAVEARRVGGDMGFFDLPYAGDTIEQVRELADGFGQWFEDVVVLGIGGSGLGAVVIRDALLGPFWNERSDDERDHFPRLHVVDNPDPFTFRSVHH